MKPSVVIVGSSSRDNNAMTLPTILPAAAATGGAAQQQQLARRALSSSPSRFSRYEVLDSSWSEDSDYHSPGDCEHYYKRLMAASQLEALEAELDKIAFLRSEIVRSEMNLCGVICSLSLSLSL